MNENENAVVAVFPDQATAEAAVEELRAWDKRVDEVKLGNIGTVANEGGAVRKHLVQAGLFHRTFPISDAAAGTLANELGEGQVAVCVSADDYEVSMVTDLFTRKGGRIVAAHYERTAEEIEKEQKDIEHAQFTDAVETQVEKDSRPTSYNMNKPM